jgi:hypothetical protein
MVRALLIGGREQGCVQIEGSVQLGREEGCVQIWNSKSSSIKTGCTTWRERHSRSVISQLTSPLRSRASDRCLCGEGEGGRAGSEVLRQCRLGIRERPYFDTYSRVYRYGNTAIFYFLENRSHYALSPNTPSPAWSPPHPSRCRRIG